MIDVCSRFRAVAAAQRIILSRAKPGETDIDGTQASSVARLNKILKTLRFSPAYMNEQRRIISEYTGTLNAMPGLRHLAADWAYMPKKQLDVLREKQFILCGIQAKSGIPVEPAPLEWMEHDTLYGQACTNIVQAHGRDDRIRINRAPSRGNTAHLSVALDTLGHEQTHIFQGWLARAVYFELIPKDHPLSDDGWMIWARWICNARIAASLKSSYALQFIEEDADAVGQAVHSLIDAMESIDPDTGECLFILPSYCAPAASAPAP